MTSVVEYMVCIFHISYVLFWAERSVLWYMQKKFEYHSCLSLNDNVEDDIDNSGTCNSYGSEKIIISGVPVLV